jgi:hypothetical protein
MHADALTIEVAADDIEDSHHAPSVIDIGDRNRIAGEYRTGTAAVGFTHEAEFPEESRSKNSDSEFKLWFKQGNAPRKRWPDEISA